jgi:hypothetical protein
MPGTISVRANYPDTFLDLLAGLEEVYSQSRQLQAAKSDWKKVFSMKDSDTAFEQMASTVGFPKFGTVGEAADVPLYNGAQLFDKKFTHTKTAGAWQISEEMQDDDKFSIVADLGKSAGRSYRYTYEVDHANVINNGASTETAADGIAIFGAHVLYNGSTITNGVSTDFSVSAAQAMFNHFRMLTDDQGIRIGLKPKYFLAPPHMLWVYKEVMKSEWKPYVATNEMNAVAEEVLTPIWWSEISDTDSWSVWADPDDVDGKGLVSFDRKGMETDVDFQVRNLTAISVIRGRWSRGCFEWRQGYGSAGA